jgi:phosphoketolase
MPIYFTKKESESLIKDGGIRLKDAQYNASEADIILVAIGSYQLREVIRASNRLKDRKIAHIAIYIIEPGRFRRPRNKGEEKHVAEENLVQYLFPKKSKTVVFMTHNRPELILGLMHPILNGKNYSGLGFIGEGGTLNVDGMLFVNKCSWAHALREIARISDVSENKLLSDKELKVIKGKLSPHGIIF